MRVCCRGPGWARARAAWGHSAAAVGGRYSGGGGHHSDIGVGDEPPGVAMRGEQILLDRRGPRASLPLQCRVGILSEDTDDPRRGQPGGACHGGGALVSRIATGDDQGGHPTAPGRRWTSEGWQWRVGRGRTAR